jgi:predicted PurR-regulated permease PerM
MEHQIHPNKIRQILFVIVLVLLGFVIAKEMFFMLGAFLGAITLYVLMRNTMIKLVVDFKWKRPLAALLLMLISFIVLVVPIAWLTSMLVEKVSPYIQDTSKITNAFQQINGYLLNKLNLDILNEKNISAINSKLLGMAQSTLGGTVSIVGSIFFMYFILYFLLTQTDDVELWLRKNVPFKHSNVHIVLKEIKQSIYGNAVGIPIVAIAQGLVGLIGYVIFGVKEFFFMGILTTVCSVIPVVGSMLIYLPLALFELSQGRNWQGIGIGIWGFAVIGSVDNIVRFWLAKKMNNVHPLITIFGVVIGVPLFGFLGVIFGPLLLSIFILLIKIYVDEFGKARSKETRESGKVES